MAEKILQLIKKYRDLIIYVILGVLTTAVNFLVYFPLHTVLGVPAATANAIAWAVSVVFAFLTNKPFAFRSYDWSPKVAFPEFIKFVACRIGSGIAETLFIKVTVEILLWHSGWMKVIISIAVVIANYVSSKLFAFKKK